MSDGTQQGGGATTPDPAAGNGGGNGGNGGAKTFTQDELERIVGERLGRERQKYADYDDLKSKATEFDKLAESQKTDLEKVTGERDQFRVRAETAESRLLRFEVAAAKGLPSKWASRLTGSSKEELEADADALLQELGPPRGGFDGGARGTGAPPADMDAAIRRAAGRA